MSSALRGAKRAKSAGRKTTGAAPSGTAPAIAPVVGGVLAG
ncbi:MAG: hypothetical protein ACKOUM_06800 [Sphingopyxis sp.]